MPSDKRLDFTIGANAASAVTEYNRFVDTVVIGAKKIQAARGNPFEDFAKVTQQVLADAGQSQESFTAKLKRETEERKKAVRDEHQALTLTIREQANAAKRAAQERTDAETRALAEQKRKSEELLKSLEDGGKRRIELEERLQETLERIQKRESAGKTAFKKDIKASEKLRAEIEEAKLLEAQAAKAGEVRAQIEELANKRILEIDRRHSAERRKIAKQEADAIKEATLQKSGALEVLDKQGGVFGRIASAFEPFRKSLKEGKFEAQEFAGGITNAARALGPYGGALILAATALTALVAGLKKAVDATAAQAKELDDLQKITKSDDLTTAKIAANFKLIGGSANDAKDAIGQLNDVLLDADKNKDVLAAFKAFDLDPKNLKSAGEAFDAIVSKLAELGPSAERTAALQKLVGEEGRRQVIALAEAYDGVGQKLQDFDLILTKSQREGLGEYRKAVGSLELLLDGLVSQIGAGAAPAFAKVVNEITAFVASLDLGGGKLANFVGAATELTFALLELVSLGLKPVEILVKGFAGVFNSLSQLVAPLFGNTQQFRGELTSLGTVLESFAETINAILHPLDTLNFLLTGNSNATKQETKATKENADGKQKAAEVNKELADSLRALQDEYQKTTDAVKSNADFRKAQIEEYTKNELEAAKQIAEVNKRTNQEILDAATTRLTEVTKKVRQAGTDVDRTAAEAEQRQAFLDFEQALTQATAQGVADRRKIEQAAAKERQEQIQNAFKDLEVAIREETNLIDEKERKHTITAKQAVQERFELVKAGIELQIGALEAALTQENVGAEEKKQIEQQVTDLRRQLRQEEVQSNKAAREAEVKDEQQKLATLSALNEQQKTKTDIEIADKTRRLKEAGIGEIEIAQQVARIKAASIEQEIRALDATIRQKQANNATEAELIQLETQRLQLVAQLANAQAVASGRVVESFNAQRSAIEEANTALVDYITRYTSQSNLGIPGAAAKSREAVEKEMAAAAAAASGIYSQLASISGQATEYAKTITAENVREAMAWIDTLQKRINQFGEGDGQIGGLIREANKQNQEAIETIQAAIDKALQEEARKRIEAAKEEARRIAEEFDRLRERELEETEQANERLAEAEQRYRDEKAKADAELAKKEEEIRTKGEEALEKIESEWAERRNKRAEAEADRLLKIEEDLQRSKRDAMREAAQRTLDDEADRILSEAEARKKLSDPKATAEEKKEAQGTLDDIDAARNRDRRRADEEAVARSQAKSADELAILLKAIDDKYKNEAQYYEQRKLLQEIGDAKALAALEANFAQQQAAIQKARQDALDDLNTRLANEKAARDAAAAEEDQEYTDRLNTQKEANADALAEAKRAHAEKLAELKANLKQERDEHAQALIDIRTNLETELQKMGQSWEDYLNFVKNGLAGIAGQGGPPGGDKEGSGSGAGGNDKGGGGGASIRTSDNDGGKNSSGSSPGGDGKKGSSQRTPPPSPPPPPKATQPPASSPADFAEVGSNPFGQPKDQTDKFFNRDARPVLAQVVNLLKKGDATGAREVFGVLRRLFAQRESSLTPEFAKSVSSTLEAYERKLKEAEGQPDESGKQIIQDHSKPNATGEPPPGPELTGTGQRIDDKPGGGKPATGTETKPASDSPAPKPFDPGKEGADFPTTAQLILQRLTKKELTEKDALDAWKAAVSERPELRPFDAAVIKRIKEVGSKQKNVTGAATVGPGLTAQTVPDVNQATRPALQPQGFEAVARAESDEAAKRAATASKAGRDGATVNQNFVLEVQTMRQALEAVERLITDGAIAAGITVE